MSPPDPRPADDRLPLAALLVVVAVAFAGSTAADGLGRYTLDDAYLVEHSVRGILAGGETRFIDSTPWEGVTSPIYVAAVLILAIVVPVPLAHALVGAGASLAFAAGAFVLCRRRALDVARSIAVVVVALASGMTFHHLTNGLETGLAMAAVAWTFVAFDDERPSHGAYVLLGVQPFVRPELAALSLLMLGREAMRGGDAQRRGLVIATGSFVGLALAVTALTGSPIPNTMVAKTFFFAEGCQNAQFKASFLARATLEFLVGLGPVACGFALVVAARQSGVAAGFAAAFFAAYFLRFPGALFHNQARYAYLLLPLAILGWAACLGHANRTVRRLSGLAGVVTAVMTVLAVPSNHALHVERRADDRSNGEASRWVRDHVPRDAVVLVHDAGRISLEGEQRLFDLVGLKSRYAIDVHRRTTYAACGRVPGAIVDIARHARASYVVVTHDWNRLFGITASLRRGGWTVTRADRERGPSHYRVYRIEDPRSTTR